jgi:hypothetical protein
MHCTSDGSRLLYASRGGKESGVALDLVWHSHSAVISSAREERSWQDNRDSTVRWIRRANCGTASTHCLEHTGKH